MSVKVDQAFVQAFIDGSFGLPIAHENENYDPTPGTPYVALKIFQNAATAFDTAYRNEITGVFQFTLRYAPSKGAMEAKTKAQQLLDAFPLYRRIQYDGQVVRIVSHQRLSGFNDGGWFNLPCRLNFQAYTPR